MVAPSQFLRGETYQSAMCSERRQRPSEAETVGQEDVRTFRAELLAIESLPQQDVADDGFGRRYQYVVGIPTATTDIPASFTDIVFHFLVHVGIVLFHPSILDCPLEVEQVIGVAFQQGEIAFQSIFHVFVDGRLHIPVPLRVEMCVRHDVSFQGLGGFLRQSVSAESANEGQGQKVCLFHVLV